MLEGMLSWREVDEARESGEEVVHEIICTSCITFC